MWQKLVAWLQVIGSVLGKLSRKGWRSLKLLGDYLLRTIYKSTELLKLNWWCSYWQRLNNISRISLQCLLFTMMIVGGMVGLIKLSNQLKIWQIYYRDSKAAQPIKPVSPLIMYVDGTGLNYRQKIFLRRLNPFMVFIGNVNLESPKRVKILIAEVKRTLRREHVLFMIDQEGGIVDRLGKIANSKYPSIRQLTANAQEDLETKKRKVYEYGKRIGKELKAIGIEVNTMPIIDVVSKTNEEMIRGYLPSTFRAASDMVKRSFSSDPQLVSIFAKEFGRGMQEMGVHGCIKHLPGLGGAVVDTHYAPAVINKSLTELRKEDFIPIYANIHDYPFAMVSWAIYPAIDPDLPAVLSKKVIKFIREEFKYRGLLVTDALNMGGAVENGEVDFAQRIRQSLEAGIDLVMPHIELNNSNIQKYASLFDEVLTPEVLQKFNRRLQKLGYATD